MFLIRVANGEVQPGVDDGAASCNGTGSVTVLAVLHIDSDDLKGAVQEDSAHVNILVAQVAGAALVAGDEDILVGLLVRMATCS